MDTQAALPWLLSADPDIRWQALRDLTDAAPDKLAAERARISQDGISAQILSSQEPDGAWRRPDAPTWLTTLFTLQLLRATGIDPADPAVVSALARAETNLRWNDYPGCWDLRSPDFGPAPAEGNHGCEIGGNPFFQGEEEPCINGGVLAFGAYFGHPNETIARRLLNEQLPDGGWNCEAPKSQRSSFNTTICVLEGLLEYEHSIGPAHPMSGKIAMARHRAEEYLLDRHLFRRLTTGETASPEFLEFAFPPRYHYDILRALDYLRAAGRDPSDPRLRDAIQIVESKRQANGRWLLDRAYDEAVTISTGETTGQPSRWNTLRALRVLRWSTDGTSR
ncbi:MAG: hypothetical protein JST28_05365 [Acidobacteria bacterium]|nr:hypothetical protein [Acidobacteriota bacterium]